MTGDDVPRVGLAVPPGWERTAEPGGGTSARPAGAGTGAPAVTVVVQETPATSAEEHALRSIGELAVALSDLRVIGQRVGEGRVDLVVAHEMLGVDVTTLQRHLLGPEGRVVVAAATVADVLWPGWRGTLERIVDGVEVEW